MYISESQKNSWREQESPDEYAEPYDESESEAEAEQSFSFDDSPMDNSLREYLREVGEIPLLTPEEEIELTKKVAEGDAKAKDDLIRANLRLVINIARRYNACNGSDLMDLIQEGNVGLIKAADHFDPSKGFRFSTYATWWIREFVNRGYEKTNGTVHFSVGFIESRKKINKYREQFYAKNERNPSIKELAEHFNMSEKKIQRLVNVDTHTLSLDDPIAPESDVCFVEVLLDENAVDPKEACDKADIREQLFKAFDILSDKERNVLIMRFGLDGNRPMTLEAIGKKMNATKEWIRVIEKRSLEKLKKNPRTAEMLSNLLY